MILNHQDSLHQGFALMQFMQNRFLLHSGVKFKPHRWWLAVLSLSMHMSLLKRSHILQHGCFADVEPKVLKGNRMEEIMYIMYVLSNWCCTYHISKMNRSRHPKFHQMFKIPNYDTTARKKQKLTKNKPTHENHNNHHQPRNGTKLGENGWHRCYTSN